MVPFLPPTLIDSEPNVIILGQQRCIATYHSHSEGVWALQPNENFTQVCRSFEFLNKVQLALLFLVMGIRS